MCERNNERNSQPPPPALLPGDLKRRRENYDNEMLCPCAKVPSSGCRRFRCTHGQALVLLLVYSCCWTISRVVSPSAWTVNEVEKCFDNPESLNCAVNKTLVPRYSNLTTSSSESLGATLPITTEPPQQPQHRHPNFTFDFPLCLVHVGKTAGSSVSCGLGLMYADCEGMPRQPSLLHTEYFHMRRNNCPRNNNNSNQKGQGIAVATLLMTVRNPLTRIQSWFNFEKDILPTRRNKQAEERLRWKRGMLFSDCYQNFVDLVVEGLELSASATNGTNDTYTISTERPINMTCQERAWAAILGVREFSYHEWYNYEHYWTALQDLYLGGKKDSNLKPPSLLVLRSEHLSEDWSKLSKEELFRQVNKGNRSSSVTVPLLSPNTTSTGFSTNGSSTIQTSDEAAMVKNASSRFWRNLCRAICPEIRIYQQILEHADNLNPSQVGESLSELQAMCPWYDSKQSSSSCPEIPQFPLIKVPRRQYFGETKKRLFVIG